MASMTNYSNVAHAQNSSTDDEESFVVLGNGSEPQDSLAVSLFSLSTNASTESSTCNTPEMPKSAVNELTQAIAARSVSIASEMSFDDIQLKLETLMKENLILKEKLYKNNVDMKKQLNAINLWQEEVKKVHESHREKFEETKKLVANLRAENGKLKESLAGAPLLQQENEELRSQVSALEREVQALREADAQARAERSHALQEAEQLQQSLRDEAERHRTDLQVTRFELVTARDQLLQCQREMMQLAAQPSLTLTVDTLKAEVQTLQAELDLKNQTLREKSDSLDRLTKEARKLAEDVETIPILKLQVDQYKSDFLQERDGCKRFEAEKKQLAEDLQLLQQRNEELMAEVERMRESGFVHVSMPTRIKSSSSRESTPPAGTFDCPLCGLKFRSLYLVQEHAGNCGI